MFHTRVEKYELDEPLANLHKMVVENLCNAGVSQRGDCCQMSYFEGQLVSSCCDPLLQPNETKTSCPDLFGDAETHVGSHFYKWGELHER